MLNKKRDYNEKVYPAVRKPSQEVKKFAGYTKPARSACKNERFVEYTVINTYCESHIDGMNNISFTCTCNLYLLQIMSKIIEKAVLKR
jgi:hypothetical protein